MAMPDPLPSNDKPGGCCTANCLKYVLCLYNFVFLLSGCVICGLGLWTILEKWVFVQLMASGTYEATTWLLVCTGCLSVVTALLGYTAIAFENRCLLAWYTILLVIVFMFESVIGLLSYVYQDQIDNDLQASLKDTFILTYSLDMENTRAVDKIQTKHSCCGSSGFSDWLDSPWHLQHPDMAVPDSCCKTVSPGCGIRDHPSNIPYTGCIHRFSAELSQHLVLVGSVSLGIALLQVLGVLLTSCLFSKLHKLDKYLPVTPGRTAVNGRSWSDGE
eukprot:GFUD01016762.1.p1 GENE.GFUD01016762.1~~GFUD01016762.1.p1  ORF type:complete len:274 (-),score=82.19 GFUD01016762.1:120-941(-)